MKSFMTEFKEFAVRGNVMSLAVGMIIGLAFQEVVSSLTDNILSPIIGILVGQNFDYLELNILGVSLRYGAFITSVFNFIILAFVVFLIVRSMNKLAAEPSVAEPPAAEPSVAEPEVEAAVDEPKRVCPFCMSEVHENATRCSSCTSELSV